MPQSHRTVDCVTRILETGGLSAWHHRGRNRAHPRSAEGLDPRLHPGAAGEGWLYEQDHRLYLGPAVYGLILASGHIRAGEVTHADWRACRGRPVLPPALVFWPATTSATSPRWAVTPSRCSQPGRISEGRSWRPGGKALLAVLAEREREAFLRRRGPDEVGLVEYDAIKRTRIATNIRLNATRVALATTVRNHAGRSDSRR